MLMKFMKSFQFDLDNSEYFRLCFYLVLYALTLVCTYVFAEHMVYLWSNHAAAQQAQAVVSVKTQNAETLLALKAQHAEQLAHQMKLVELKLQELQSIASQEQAVAPSFLHVYLTNAALSVLLSQVTPFVLKVGLAQASKITLVGKALAWLGLNQGDALAQITRELAVQSEHTRDLARAMAQQGAELYVLKEVTDHLRELSDQQATVDEIFRDANERAEARRSRSAFLSSIYRDFWNMDSGPDGTETKSPPRGGAGHES